MVDAIIITLDKPYTFRFNNYALIELGKLCKCDPTEAGDALMRIASENMFIGLSYVLYAGIVGYNLSQLNLNHGLTPQFIAEYIGNASPEQLVEINKAWASFDEAQGITAFLQEQETKRRDEVERLEKAGEPIPSHLKKKIAGRNLKK